MSARDTTLIVVILAVLAGVWKLSMRNSAATAPAAPTLPAVLQAAGPTALADAAAMSAKLPPHVNAARFRGDFMPSYLGRRLLRLLEVPDIPVRAATADAERVFVVRASRLDTGGELLLALWAVRSGTPSPESRLGRGDVIECSLIEAGHLPEAILSIERIDVAGGGGLTLFFGSQVTPPILSIVEAGIDTTPPQGRSRQRVIREELSRINDLLARHDGSWTKWHASLAPMRADILSQLDGSDFYAERQGFVYRRMRAHPRGLKVTEFEPTGDWPEPQVAVLAALHEQLASRGIDLIVVPVPEKEFVSARTFTSLYPADGVIAPWRLQVHKALLEAGVEVLDVLPALIAASRQRADLYYGGTDHHLADGGIQVVSRAIAARLERYQLSRQWDRFLLTRRIFNVGEKETALFGGFEFAATSVFDPGYKPVEEAAVSPAVLFIGDSILMKPSWFGVPSANIAAHFARISGLPYELFGRAGVQSQIMKHLARSPQETLQGKRVCVFVFQESMLQLNEGKFAWEIVELP